MGKLRTAAACVVAGAAIAVAACTPPTNPAPSDPPLAPDILLPVELGADVTVHLLHRGQGGVDESIVTRTDARPLTDPLDATDRALLAEMAGRLDPATGRVLVGYADNWLTSSEVGVCESIGSHECTTLPGTEWASTFSFSPDGTKVATITPYGPFGDSVDGRLQVWDVATRTEITHADDAIAMLGPPRWRPSSDAVAFTHLRTTDNPYAGDLAVIAATPGASPTTLVAGTDHAWVTVVLGWSTSGRLSFTTIDPDAQYPAGTTLRSVGDAGGATRTLMMTVESTEPGVALADGTILANQPGHVGLASVPHLVRDVEGSAPQPLASPVSWVEGSRTRWSNTMVLGALAG